jgi:hypothetical protein
MLTMDDPDPTGDTSRSSIGGSRGNRGMHLNPLTPLNDGTIADNDPHDVNSNTTYIVMIHKLYVERIQTYLLHRFRRRCDRNSDGDNYNDEWTATPLSSSGSHPTDDAATATDNDDNDHDNHSKNNNNNNNNNSNNISFRILDVPSQTGVSQERRGYVILWIRFHPHIHSPLQLFLLWHQLSPMIRQNVAWIAPIQQHHQHHYHSNGSSFLHHPHPRCMHHDDDDDEYDDDDLRNDIGQRIWSTIRSTLHLPGDTVSTTTTSSLLLRVDVYPKSWTEWICQQLQQQALLEEVDTKNISNNHHHPPSNTTTTTITIDPFDGPIP